MEVKQLLVIHAATFRSLTFFHEEKVSEMRVSPEMTSVCIVRIWTIGWWHVHRGGCARGCGKIADGGRGNDALLVTFASIILATITQTPSVLAIDCVASILILAQVTPEEATHPRNHAPVSKGLIVVSIRFDKQLILRPIAVELLPHDIGRGRLRVIMGRDVEAWHADKAAVPRAVRGHQGLYGHRGMMDCQGHSLRAHGVAPDP
jgi:hypothetical protein